MNFGKEIKRAIRTAEGRRRIFFRFFLLIVLGNVFYFPEGYADRFFTPGMLWTGIAVGVSGMLFPFVVSGRVGLPGLACVAVGILAVVGGKSAGGFFAWQTGVGRGYVAFIRDDGIFFRLGETGRLVWGIVVRGRGGSVCRNRAICRDMAGV